MCLDSIIRWNFRTSEKDFYVLFSLMTSPICLDIYLQRISSDMSSHLQSTWNSQQNLIDASTSKTFNSMLRFLCTRGFHLYFLLIIFFPVLHAVCYFLPVFFIIIAQLFIAFPSLYYVLIRVKLELFCHSYLPTTVSYSYSSSSLHASSLMLSQSDFIDDAVIIVRQGTKRKEEELLTIWRQNLDFQQKEQSKLWPSNWGHTYRIWQHIRRSGV